MKSPSFYLLLFIVLLSNSKGFGQFCFGSPVDYNTAGLTPRQVITTDFNVDGRNDLIVGNTSSKSLSFLMGDGLGTFSVSFNYSLNAGPSSLISSDFNGDMKPDIATVNGNSVTILLGDGVSSCTSYSNISIGSQPVFIVSSDFNNDLKIDLAIAHFGANFVSILTGNGDGSFNAPVTYNVGSSPASIEIADFNNDDEEDLAVVNNGSSDMSILLGSTSGTFSLFGTFPVGNLPSSLTSFDINSDSQLDIMVANYQSNNISLLIGNGTGSFVPTSTINVNTPITLTHSDLNGDGKQDLISTNNYFIPGVNVFFGNGSGGFGTANGLTAGTAAFSILCNDFNGDLIPDIAVANADPYTVTIFLNCFGVGIKELSERSIALYPNPVKESVKIDVGTFSVSSITITNVLGQTILDLSPQIKEIDMSSVASGIYFLRLVINGRERDFKIIKQ